MPHGGGSGSLPSSPSHCHIVTPSHHHTITRPCRHPRLQTGKVTRVGKRQQWICRCVTRTADLGCAPRLRLPPPPGDVGSNFTSYNGHNPPSPAAGQPRAPHRRGGGGLCAFGAAAQGNCSGGSSRAHGSTRPTGRYSWHGVDADASLSSQALPCPTSRCCAGVRARAPLRQCRQSSPAARECASSSAQPWHSTLQCARLQQQHCAATHCALAAALPG